MGGIGRLLLGRILGLGLLFAGFWLLYQGFLRPNVGIGILGGIMIPLAMWTMTRTARKP